MQEASDFVIRTTGRAKRTIAGFDPAINPPRGYKARGCCAAASPRNRKNLTEISAALSTGG
jgi:hypothetical protein